MCRTTPGTPAKVGCDPARQTCHCAFFDTWERGAGVRACRQLLERDHASPIVRVRLPAGGVTVAANVNDVAHLAFLWRGTVGRDGVTLQAPVELWHN